jgi:hypothetical protein
MDVVFGKSSVLDIQNRYQQLRQPVSPFYFVYYSQSYSINSQDSRAVVVICHVKKQDAKSPHTKPEKSQRDATPSVGVRSSQPNDSRIQAGRSGTAKPGPSDRWWRCCCCGQIKRVVSVGRVVIVPLSRHHFDAAGMVFILILLVVIVGVCGRIMVDISLAR